MTKQKTDIIENITSRIEAALEQGTAPWIRPWRSEGGEHGGPVNVARGTYYRGINIMALMLSQMEAGYSSSIWGTYKQWKARGGNVCKGEKGTQIVFWKIQSKTEKDKSGEEVERRWAMARGYTVFNFDQTENCTLPPRFAPDVEDDGLDTRGRIVAVDEFANATGITWKEGGGNAFYRPSTDSVHIPKFRTFTTPDLFATTLLHEFVHASGSKKRLGRLTNARFGEAEYAKEELVAESGAAMLSCILGVDVDNVDHHASYLQSWLKALENDRRFLVSAFSQAQQAVDYLLELSGVEMQEVA